MPHGAGGVRSRAERLGQAGLDYGNAGEADSGRAEICTGDSVAPRAIEGAEAQGRLNRVCRSECSEAGDALGTVGFQTKFAAAKGAAKSASDRRSDQDHAGRRRLHSTVAEISVRSPLAFHH